jgi:NAD(P)H-hydrate epimerase
VKSGADDPVESVVELPRLPARPADAHKGHFGRVLVVGGSRGMIGAPALAANAALRGGAGLVTVAVPETVQLTVASLCPCATSLALHCGPDGELTPQAARQMLTAAGRCDVLAVGPGMGVSAGAGQLVTAVLDLKKPVVMDADALNNLARIDRWPERRHCPAVLTPHPGEFATLTGRSIDEIQADRQGSAVGAIRLWAAEAKAGDAPLVVALKGAGTVVTDGRRALVNRTGNPGMATGGTGDVLTGLIAALIGQGMGLFESACLGVHVHGLAGDLAAEKLGQVSTMASDLVELLPQALGRAR